MSSEEILPLCALPVPLQKRFYNFVDAINRKEINSAREEILPVLEHYISQNKETPEEISFQYGKLLLLEQSQEQKEAA